MNELTKTFIKKAKVIYNNKYDYSLTNYINNKTKIKIKCNTCGYLFEKSPKHFLEGIGCPVCNASKRINTEIFIFRAKKLYPGFDYSNTRYVNAKTPVSIYCNICKKELNILPFDFLKRGCGHRFISSEAFIEKAKLLNNDYDYSETEFVNYRTKIKIKCKFCNNEKYALPGDLLKAHKCKCLNRNLNFINEANKLHDSSYDYSLINYINNKTKIKIICKKCGSIFEQIPHDHLAGKGCPLCRNSKGEMKIKSFLDKNKISYKKEKTFDDLYDKQLLRYDFYLPSHNLLIEYNGIQHYKSIRYFGGRKQFLLQKHHDWLKRKYALKNNYNLLTITYKDDNIEQILKEKING